MRAIRVVDSHTGGEPTRVVIEGGPDLGRGSLAERRERFRRDHDRYRSAIVAEPRGSEAMVGALLCEPEDAGCEAGVIFFDNAGYLGMCGHGTIGLVVTLAHLGRLGPGSVRIETPVGIVSAQLHGDERVSLVNVPSWRHRAGVAIEVPGHGQVTGDVAWGGNWFFLADAPPMDIRLANVRDLTSFAGRIRKALFEAGVRGEDRSEVDHVELFAPSPTPRAASRNFVLCPGYAYDRSPCGTGTSAKLACLHADGRLRPGEVWRQESVTGSIFEGRFTLDPSHAGRIIPEIAGAAHVTGEATLFLDERDPLCWGIRDRA